MAEPKVISWHPNGIKNTAVMEQNDIYIFHFYNDYGKLTRVECIHSETKKHHNLNGPAYISYHSNGKKYVEEYYKQGEFYNPNGYAYIVYDKNGKVIKQKFKNT